MSRMSVPRVKRRMNLTYWFFWKLSRIFFRLAGVHFYQTDYVPPEGSYILASNHVSYLDPPLVGCWIKRPLAFFAKKELFESFWLGPLVSRLNSLPVRRGAIDRNALSNSLAMLKSGTPLTVFPEGTRSRTTDFLPPKAGVGLLARKALVPILPAYLHGSNHIKDCLLRRERLSVTYGPVIPVDWIESQPDSKEGYFKIATEVLARVAEIRDAEVRNQTS